MDAPGSRMLLRPSGLGRGGPLRRGVPGHGRLLGSGPLDDPGADAHLRTEIQIEDTGGTRMVLAGFPPLAFCAVTGDQFRRQDDRPTRHAPADGGTSAIAIRKTLSAADPCVVVVGLLCIKFRLSRRVCCEHPLHIGRLPG